MSKPGPECCSETQDERPQSCYAAPGAPKESKPSKLSARRSRNVTRVIAKAKYADTQESSMFADGKPSSPSTESETKLVKTVQAEIVAAPDVATGQKNQQRPKDPTNKKSAQGSKEPTAKKKISTGSSSAAPIKRRPSRDVPTSPKPVQEEAKPISSSTPKEGGNSREEMLIQVSSHRDPTVCDPPSPILEEDGTSPDLERRRNNQPCFRTPLSLKEIACATTKSDKLKLQDQVTNLSMSPQTGRRSSNASSSGLYNLYVRRTSSFTSGARSPQPRARRSLSFCGMKSTPEKGHRNSESGVGDLNDPGTVSDVTESSGTSADSLRNLNLELRDQVSKLRYQLEAQKGSIKQVQWQKVLDIRHVRQQEQQRLTLALNEQKEKLDKEKARELESIREQLTQKADSDLQKLTRHKDAEISKLKLEVASKDAMVQRVLGENRHARLKLDIDVRRSKLLDEIKELKSQKKILEDSLSSASFAERSFSNDLRRSFESFEIEVLRVKREAQIEVKQLIEQLKNKDKLISQLEKDLGQKWVAAQLAALERENGEGAQASARGSPSHPLSALPEDSCDPTPFTWTPTSTPTTGGVEEARSNNVEGNSLGKQDLPKKLKDCKDRNKELVEKCRAYLQRNKELTAQNRAYKDSSGKVLQENKKMHELLEHSKLRVLQLSRQLSEAQSAKTNVEQHAEVIEELRQEMMEDKKTISALKQACSEKDRRIELIQHRKKRRRLIGSADKSMGVKETFFGYDEDTKSVDSENSFSSVSHSTISDEDVWDEVMTREETERHYQRLMMEHLQLQKSHAQLQSQSEHIIQDPQREALTKMTLQNDLVNAHCKIEKLEKLINEIGEGEVVTLLKEREIIVTNNNELLEKAQFWESESKRTQLELSKALERSEDLEFQLMEIEQAHSDNLKPTCEDSSPHSALEDHEELEKLAEIDHLQHIAIKDMEQLRKELVSLLKGKGREGDAVLKRLDQITEDEKRRAQSLESMAHELQMKVIAVQKERDSLYDKLSQNPKSQRPGKGDQTSRGDHGMTAAAKEKQENLELKTEIAKLSSSESKLLAERIHLQEQLEDWKVQYDYLKQQVDILLSSKHQEHSLKGDTSSSASSDISSPSASSSSSNQLTRKPSKDRKSKPRSGDDPTEAKRRRSSKDVLSSNESLSGGIKSFKSLGDLKSSPEQVGFSRDFHGREDMLVESGNVGEVEILRQKLRVAGEQLQTSKEENFTLRDQLRQCVLEKSSEAEADQQILLDKVQALESELNLLRRENVALAQKVKQRVEEFHDHQDEMSPRMAELEDYCDDLQDRLRSSEIAERQIREKLKLVEMSIDDAETSEMAMREKYEELLSREAEAKKQISELQRTGRELKDIVMDKDIVEQALRDKVDFLQKAEAASVKRIDELEAIEQDLREQLELRSDPKEGNQRELNKIQELKHQITFLETDNKALSARVAELEENEEILRENWRRVADEDFNRTQCLEEKVKMLETVNRDLKSKLTDAQEYFVINTVSQSENSLADELAQSQSKPIRPAASFEGGDDEDSIDGDESTSSDATQGDTEKKVIKEKLRKLERQLSDVNEQKNSKIESLQEQIVDLKENEIKLSESISEMEMTERELRAKLALYESSEVTVEKMMKYQSKIEELRTSQESLLDQIESMENQEMTLQEKLQEVERTLRGKIVTLEVEMKGYKQRELKNAARIRELEKQEKELSEKVAQQAEKENGLYIKISSLMDEFKKAKTELTSVKTKMEEKEDQVRKAKLLELKVLEMEMEHAKKLSAISSKLRHKEEELRQKEAAHEEEMASLHQELADKDAEKRQQASALDKTFAQKEKALQSTVTSLKEDIRKLKQEKEKCELQMKDLIDSNNELQERENGYAQEMDILRQEVTSIKTTETEYEDQISHLKEEVEKEKQRADGAEGKAASLEQELAHEKENVLTIEKKLISLKDDISVKMKNIESSFVEKENEYEKEKQALQEELSMKDERVRELERELGDRMKRVHELETQCEELNSKAATGEKDLKKKISDLENLIEEKDEQLAELEHSLAEKEKDYEIQMAAWEADCDALKTEMSDRDIEIKHLNETMEAKTEDYKKKLSAAQAEQEMLENELRNKVMFLNTQLTQERSTSKASEDKEKAFNSEIDRLMNEVEHHRLELVQKLSVLEVKNKENCELSLELSNLRHSNKTLQKELDGNKIVLHDTERKFQAQIQERDQKLEMQKQDLGNAKEELEQLKVELSHKENVLQEIRSDKEQFLNQKQLQIEELKKEKMQNETIVQEHMQKSEHLLQQSKQEQESRNVEFQKFKDELWEKKTVLQEQLARLSEKDSRIKELESRIQDLEGKLSEANKNLEEKISEVQQYMKEMEEVKEENDTIVSNYEILEKQLEETQEEVKQKSAQHTDTQSLISAKQQELEQARNELQKCLQEIEQYKSSVQDKENKLQQLDQTNKETSERFEQLNVEYQQRDHTYEQMKSKVSAVELRLVEAENRYRELEAQVASLEMQLEERFAEAQEAEKIIKSKDEEFQNLEMKLSSLEQKYQEKSAHFLETEELLKLKEEECKELESQLESIEVQHKELLESLSHSEREHQQQQAETTSLRNELNKFQTEQLDLHAEIKFLRTQSTALEEKCEESTSQLKASEDQLLETRDKCEKLELRLKQSESLAYDNDSRFTDLQSDMSVLERKCAETETKLNVSEKSVKELENTNNDKQRTIETLEASLRDSEVLCEETKSNLCKATDDFKSQLESLQNKLAQAERDLKISEEKCEKLTGQLSLVEGKLLGSNQQTTELTAKIATLEIALKEKESFCRDSQNDLGSLEHRHVELQTECEHLKAELTKVQQTLSSTQTLHDDRATKLKEAQMALEQSQKELTDSEEKLSEKETLYKEIYSSLEQSQKCVTSIQDEANNYSVKVNSLEDRLKEVLEENKDLETNCDKLIQELEEKESLCQKLKDERDAKNTAISDSQSSQSTLLTSVENMKQENAILQRKLEQNETELSELIITNQSLAGKLYQLEIRCKNSESKVTELERSLSGAAEERDDALVKIKHLEEELEDAAREFENLRSEFEGSKANVESTVNEISKGKQDSLREIEKLRQELQEKDNIISALSKEKENLQEHLEQQSQFVDELKEKMQALVSESKVMRERCVKLDADNEELTEKLADAEKTISRLQSDATGHSAEKSTSDEHMSATVVTGLHTVPSVREDSESDLRKEISSLEAHHNETVSKMESLKKEVEMYKENDSTNKEKLRYLERNLKEMKDSDSRLTDRVNELEEKERELLEQMADIETTVIIPMETENQELKDEISVIKQERDDALSKVSKWGEDEDDPQDIESIHKSLEDALVQRDELEKKIDILSQDVARLDLEKEKLSKKVTDMEASEAEHLEKIEYLEDEVERLHSLEKTTSVVEETETRLMDRVLDLEEREQQLIAELQQLKHKVVNSQSVQTVETSYGELLEKLKYLEQKNEVLQDAEGQYMDKIVDLEEMQNKLQTELSALRLSTQDERMVTSGASVEPTQAVSSDSILLLMQNSVPYERDATCGASSQTHSQPFTSTSTDTADLLQLSEQTWRTDEANAQIIQLKAQNQTLVDECTEKTSQVKYLEEKLELLGDSEARLMEKLLETEEDIDHGKSKSDSPEGNSKELKEKIEQLVEENEFLAQSVENYKKLYKEEKEKTNELNDKVLEESSLHQELLETKAELRSTQQMVEEIQSEYEEQLTEKEEQEIQLNDLLAQSQQRENDLQQALDVLKQQEEDLQKKLEAVIESSENPQAIQMLLDGDKIAAMSAQESLLKSQYDQHKQEMQKQLQSLQEDHDRLKDQEQELTKVIEELEEQKAEVEEEVESHKQKIQDLQKEGIKMQQREHELLRQIDSLENQLLEVKSTVDDATDGREEESAHSDSGLSADDQRARYDTLEKSRKSRAPEPPVEQVFSSTVTLTLAQPPSSTPGKASGRNVTQTSARRDGAQPLLPTPIPPPRRKSRNLSIDSISQEELSFLVEELQNKEAALKKRVRDLEALVDTDLSHRVEELEYLNRDLERKLRYAENSLSSVASTPAEQESSSASFLFAGGDSNNNNTEQGNNEEDDSKELDRSFSSVLSSSTNIMLDKPEDVLHQRIKELENLDKHNKNQLSELERDREVLHEIARKDKATIHDLNVKIRELQLSERSLKEQVNSLEVSENSLYSKCEDLEALKVKLEDRVHELEIHERRLRELVRRLKLDEEHWLNKSGGMETAVAELSANEQQLKRLLQDVEMEKGGLSERAEYLEARIRELENVESTLLQRLKSYENNEVSLQNRLVQLENSETAANSKASELDVMNLDLSQRLQKAVEENVVLSQHVSQLHGQVNELDRRLMSLRDSELAYKQHVESLQKNESSLQKKVREYELREIDSQARVRELEQINEILNDKMATLQRSENRLKYRVQELEGVGGQIPGELTPAQRQKVPQKLEDCQKRVVVLQNQVENLQLQLRDALKSAQTRLASQMEDGKEISMSVDEYSQLQTKSALLEETTYQMEEVESVNEQLNETILQLRHGKGASGHEVEIEVLKRRLSSYKTFINKLKSSLSTGQATSLWDPELDSGSGPQGDTLPARHLHGLESERVLQSVRGIQEGKADSLNKRGAQHHGLTVEEDSIVQLKATSSLSSQPISLDNDDESGYNQPEQATSREESHWKAIEARKPKLVASSRGGALATVGTGAKHAPFTQHNGSKQSSTQEVEEVTIGLHLPSESELSSHHRTTQNDTDSSVSPVPPPRKGRVHRISKSSYHGNQSGNDSSDGLSTDNDIPAETAMATNNKHYFGNAKSLPSLAYMNTSQQQQDKRAPLTRFGEDSFYLPSSTQEGVDSLDDDEAPPLPASGPPGAEGTRPFPWSSTETIEQREQERKDSLEDSTSGMSIRERIAMIERQLQSDQISSKADDDQVYYWKRKATDSMKQAEVLEKDNKHLKEDLPPAYRRKEKINRLEKELEEKRRHINVLELWLSNLEDLLRNQNKQTDREMVEQLQKELTKLRSELKHVGYRSDDAVLDPAALKTELEHRDKEIVFKRGEIEALNHQLKRSQEECRTIEDMRRTALDSLRALEHEIIELQDKEKQLQETQAELKSLRKQHHNKCQDLHEVITQRNELEFTLKKTILERDNFKCDLKEMEREMSELRHRLAELTDKVEDLSRVEAKNSSLEDQLNNLNSLLIQRTEKTREVYEENLNLRDCIHQSEVELMRLRNVCDDFNNLSARYDELDNYKNQAINMLQPLQAKLERLARKCQEKDALLRRLGAELRQNIYRPSSALDDLTRAEHIMGLEEYNTDFPQMTNGPTPQKPERQKGHSRSSSMDELELNYPYSDSESPVHSSSKRKRPTPSIDNRPRSADILGSGPRVQRGTHAHPRSIPGLRRTAGTHQQVVSSGVMRGQFVAIADYDPALFSQSGRRRLELELSEGDHVSVTGPMDRTGYYEAEINGRTGLVPANYLQPLEGSTHITNHDSDPWSLGGPIEQSPEYRGHSHRQVPQGAFSRPKDTVHAHRPDKNIQTQSERKHSGSQGPFPDPPHNLHVKGIVNGRSILLSWLPPNLDNKGCNKGVNILGYMVHLNNQEYEQIPSPRMCEVVVEDLNPEHSHHLAVQCLGAGGYTSARAELVFEGIVHMVQGQGQNDRGQNEEDLDTDLSSVLNSVHYKHGNRKKMMALYDYVPEQQSPHDYTNLELPFCAGDVVYVYGDPRPDGFFHGEIEGKRGLVPAYFVEEISKMTKPSQKNTI